MLVPGILNHQREALDPKCVGFVVMPDHVHCLLWLADPAELTRFLHGWKRISSDHIRDWYKQHVPNYFADFGPRERFW